MKKGEKNNAWNNDEKTYDEKNGKALKPVKPNQKWFKKITQKS